MDGRRAFVEDYLHARGTMTALCRVYGVSRKTGYKWLDRFERDGPVGLADRSRRPRTSPAALTPAVVQAVVQVRRRFPHWGVRKLRAWLRRHEPAQAWPSRTTFHRVLQRQDLIAPAPRRPTRRGADGVTGRRLRDAHAANDVWTLDFKGPVRLQNGLHCHPLTVRDLASRYTLRCDALRQETTRATRHSLARTFATYGLPRCIRSDNGAPFAGTGFARLSRLNVWWLRLGIAVEQIAPARPDQNGAHERFHRDLKAQTARPPAATFSAQQHRFEVFRREYNHQRPHEALGDAVPADRYRPSPRRFPARLPPVEYPGHWEPRTVSGSGMITWRQTPVFVSEALAGEVVAFEEVDDGIWTLHLGTVPLARWLERERCPRALRAD
jgi:transposase InsO family protein